MQEVDAVEFSICFPALPLNGLSVCSLPVKLQLRSAARSCRQGRSRHKAEVCWWGRYRQSGVPPLVALLAGGEAVLTAGELPSVTQLCTDVQKCFLRSSWLQECRLKCNLQCTH